MSLAQELLAAVGLAAAGAAAMALFSRGNRVTVEDEREAQLLVRDEMDSLPGSAGRDV